VVLAHYEHIDAIPDNVNDWEPSLRKTVRGAERLATTLAGGRELVELFRTLATLRIDRSLLPSVADLQWRGPTPAFEEVSRQLRSPALAERAAAIAAT
jgi:hypothetical protein